MAGRSTDQIPADVFGQVEAILLSCNVLCIQFAFKILELLTLSDRVTRTIVEVTSTGVESFAAGAVLYQVRLEFSHVPDY
jgi:hypothetical protein